MSVLERFSLTYSNESKEPIRNLLSTKQLINISVLVNSRFKIAASIPSTKARVSPRDDRNNVSFALRPVGSTDGESQSFTQAVTASEESRRRSQSENNISCYPTLAATSLPYSLKKGLLWEELRSPLEPFLAVGTYDSVINPYNQLGAG